jgi:Holliday junction resolvase RusA-like endonuclease
MGLTQKEPRGVDAPLSGVVDATLFWCRVPGRPIPQGRARVGRWSTYYPKTSQAYAAQLTAAFIARVRDFPPDFPLDGPVWLTIKVSGWRKGSDWDNFGKIVSDSLVRAGVLADDHGGVVQAATVLMLEGKERFLEVVIEALG